MNNESAIDFYKKFGFEIVETKERYYKRIEPADAHVLQKDLKKTNSQSGAVATTATSCHQQQHQHSQSNGLDTTHNHHGGKSKV